MTDLPRLLISVEQLDDQERATLKLTLPTGASDTATLKLPFPLAQLPLVLRALNARQYPDYPEKERLVKHWENREQITADLAALGLWSEEENVVPADVHARVGQMLGRALLSELPIRRAFDALYDAAIYARGGEMILTFDQSGALAALPWEVAYNGSQPLLLSKGVLLSCTRVIAFPYAQPPARQPGERLRVLTLAPDAGFDSYSRDFEQRARAAMASALQDLPIDIEPLPQVTMSALYHRLMNGPAVDVLDYYGHGRFKNGVGALLFDSDPELDIDESGRAWVEASKIQALPNLPPLFVLNACQSAQMDLNEPVAGLAAALSAANVRAVVAMQLTTRMAAATNGITPILYKDLADSRSLQQAVASVRQALFTREQDSASWYLPVLYLRQPDHRPYVLLAKPQPLPNPFDGMGALGNPMYLIGRRTQIQRVWARLQSGQNVSIVGPGGSGKSTIMELIIAESQQRLGADVEVIRLPLQRKMKLLDAKLALANRLGGRKATDLWLLLENKRNSAKVTL